MSAYQFYHAQTGEIASPALVEMIYRTRTLFNDADKDKWRQCEAESPHRLEQFILEDANLQFVRVRHVDQMDYDGGSHV